MGKIAKPSGWVVSSVLLFLPQLSYGEYGFAMTDESIREQIIQESINDYYKLSKDSKACACPYSTGFDGQACGGQSAYFLQNQVYLETGRELKCFPRDVSEDDVIRFRIEHGIPNRPLNPP